MKKPSVKIRKRLWTVVLSAERMVLADTPDEAERTAYAEGGYPPLPNTHCEVRLSTSLARGWDADCTPYGYDPKNEHTVGELLEIQRMCKSTYRGQACEINADHETMHQVWRDGRLILAWTDQVEDKPPLNKVPIVRTPVWVPGPSVRKTKHRG